MSADQSDLTTFGGEVQEDACVRYERCGNTVPGRGQICGPYLDELRAADRNRQREGR